MEKVGLFEALMGFGLMFGLWAIGLAKVRWDAKNR